RFRWCPPGDFMMGSPESEKDRLSWETQHRVSLTRGFWMLETEVTQEMWRSVMGNNPSSFAGARNPVENVSWNDCQEFCTKLKQKLGITIGLPTEAQWEYACRAGTTGPYGGSGDLDDMGWYYDNSGSGTHQVGTKQANAWGLYDMHGNVYEWCQDWYGSYDESPTSDPSGPSSGSRRVVRGGSWFNGAKLCRSADRVSYSPELRIDFLGFRVCSEQ
ncbi:MAG: formylglycine-generating enzyme family protein, partial [Planctomycetia bacterium]|nr:formylglycine-generating enzyme family protein [Planctomycetia bacterium]